MGKMPEAQNFLIPPRISLGKCKYCSLVFCIFVDFRPLMMMMMMMMMMMIYILEFFH